MELMTKEECLALLKNKYDSLGRLPKRSDCTVDEAARIKAFFGPWPRALEAAGIKEKRSDDRIIKNREKRARSKRRIRILKNNQKGKNEI